MTNTELTEFKTLLEEHLADLKKSHEEHLKSLPANQDRHDVESGDWSQDLEAEEVGERIVEGEANYIKKITNALLRIEQGTYGKCEFCGGDIPLARLRAKPSVTLCVDCQSEKEG